MSLEYSFLEKYLTFEYFDEKLANNININVDGNINKFGIYTVFLNAYEVDLYEIKGSIELNEVTYNFSSKFIDFNHFLYTIEYFENLNEYKIIEEEILYA